MARDFKVHREGVTSALLPPFNSILRDQEYQKCARGYESLSLVIRTRAKRNEPPGEAGGREGGCGR